MFHPEPHTKGQLYLPVVRRYCQLAVLPHLAEFDAIELDHILEMAENDPWLTLLLDEADHLIAHRYNLVCADTVRQQQQRLAQAIDACWVDHLLADAQAQQHSYHLNCQLQQALRREGVYSGPVDGIIGPQTEAAIQHLRQAYNGRYHWINAVRFPLTSALPQDGGHSSG